MQVWSSRTWWRLQLGFVGLALVMAGCGSSGTGTSSAERSGGNAEPVAEGSNHASPTSKSSEAAPEPVPLPESACDIVPLELAQQLEPSFQRTNRAASGRDFCDYEASSESGTPTTFTVALVPHRPHYLAAVRAALEPTVGHDKIVNLGDGVCAEGPAGGGRIQADLSLQVGTSGLGLVFADSESGLPCSRLIALVHESNPKLP